MAHRICPWWGGYFIDNPLRRLFHDPEKLLGPYVQPGMTAMDFGCGMGLFSIAMATLVGDGGRVIAVDLQQRMLDMLQKRAKKAKVADRITTHRCEADSIGLSNCLAPGRTWFDIRPVLPSRPRTAAPAPGQLPPLRLVRQHVAYSVPRETRLPLPAPRKIDDGSLESVPQAADFSQIAFFNRRTHLRKQVVNFVEEALNHVRKHLRAVEAPLQR